MAGSNTTTPVNQAPVTAPLAVTYGEDSGSVGVNLLSGASDPEGKALSVTGLKLTSGQKLSYTVKSGVLTFDAKAFNGLKRGETATVTFTYNVSDGKLSTPQTMTMTIVGENDAPVVKAALASKATEDAAPLSVDLLRGASDVDGDVLSVAGLSQTGGPTAQFTVENGTLVLDPAQFNGMKLGEKAVLTFTYMVTDGIASVPQTLTVTIDGRNDVPTVTSALFQTTDEDHPISVNLLDGASDVDGNTLSVASLVQSSGTKVKTTLSNGVLTIDPSALSGLKQGETTILGFTYKVSDGKGGTVPQTLTLTVEGRNDAPVVKAALAGKATEDAAPLSVALLTGASDVDGDVLSVAGLSQTGGPTAQFTIENGTLVLDPAQFNGMKVGEKAVLTFTYAVTDGIASVPQTLTVTIDGRNDAPVVASALVRGGDEDHPISVNLLDGASDVDGDALSVASLVQSSGTKVKTTLSNGVLTIDPSALSGLKQGETTILGFTYKVSDGKGGTVPQTLTLTVEGSNDAPVVKAALAGKATEDAAPLSVALLTGASDVDGDVLSVAGLSQTSGPTAQFTVENGTLVLDPAQFTGLKVGEKAVLTFTYAVTDGIASVPQTLTVTIDGRNDAPVVASALVRGGVGDHPISVNLLDGASDVDGDALSVASLVQSSGTKVKTTLSNGVLTIDPSALSGLKQGETTILGFTYKVSDGKGGTVPQTLTLTVEGSNDAPKVAVSNISAGLTENKTGLVLAKVAAIDPEGDPLTFSVDDSRFEVAAGVLRLKAAESLDYEATPNGASVTVFATDSNGASMAQVVNYKVVNVDEPLVAYDDVATTDEDSSVVIHILDNDQTAGLPQITSVSATHGTVIANADGTITYTPAANRADPAVISYTLAESGLTSSAEVAVTIVAKADAPVISGTGGSGRVYATVPLNIAAVLADSDGSEALSAVTISGVPADVILSAGTRDAATGNWTLTAAQLSGLTAFSFKGVSANLTITAHATENSNGDVAATTVTVPLTITATPSANIVWKYGTAAGDTMKGLADNDYLDGGDGNDYIYGEAGDDWLRGGAGNDYVVGSQGDDVLEGGDGNDQLRDDAGINTLVGGNGDDIIFTSGSRAVIDAGAGNDLLYLYRGDSTVATGAGSDVLQISTLAMSEAGTATIADFTPGAGGDKIDLSQLPDLLIQQGWDGTTNPFTTGLMSASTVNGSTVLRIGTGPETFTFTLLGVQASDLTADNFAPGYDFNPNGDVTAGLNLVGSGNGTTLLGGGGGDTLTAGPGGNVMRGYAGDDKIIGNVGADYLGGGTGRDTLTGGGGNDNLSGDQQDDILDGGDGNDYLVGGTGSDTMWGGAGDDTFLVGETGADTPNAEETGAEVGVDVADGGTGNDTFYLFSFAGSTITTGAGADTIRVVRYNHMEAAEVVTDFTAGPGGDRLDFGGMLDNKLPGWDQAINPFGAGGFLRVRQDGADAVVEMDGDGTAGGASFTPLFVLRNVTASMLTADNFTPAYDPFGGSPASVTLTGGTGVDSLMGGLGNDVVDGRDGDDMLWGGYGNDTVLGGAGKDYMDGGGGNDLLNGGDGNDVIYGQQGDNRIYGGAGNDMLNSSGGTDIVSGGDGDDQIDLMFAQNAILDGGDGNDTFNLAGATQSATVIGGPGRDTMVMLNDAVSPVLVFQDFSAGSSGDVIDLSRIQKERLIGWDGTSNPFGTGFLRTVQSGADTLLQVDLDGMGGAANGWKTLALLANVQASALTKYNFLPPFSPDGGGVYGVSMNGGESADLLNGTVGDDTMNGMGGADVLNGGSGNDYLYGGGDADTLSGGMGRDTLIGSAGNDTLIGGAGSDLYRFGRGDGVDTILNAQDNLDLAADELRLAAGIGPDNLWLGHVGNNLELSVLGGGDKVILADWYASSAATVQTIRLDDGRVLDQSRVENLVAAMATLTPPAAGQTTFDTAQHQALDTLIAANWKTA